MTEHDEMLDDVAIFALGAMDAAVCDKMLAHLAVCEACSKEYRRLRSIVDVLALGAQNPDRPAEPSAALKERVMAEALHHERHQGG